MVNTLSQLISENSALRGQVQILKSVPDLIVVFDASAHVHFVSQSVVDFLGLESSADIEGTPFWELVTEDSKSVIRRAFTDAVTKAEEADDSCACLNDGIPLSINFLKSKNGCKDSHLVSFKGTVHLNNGEPECVCSMRLANHALLEPCHVNRLNDTVVSDSDGGNIMCSEDDKSSETDGSHKRAHSCRVAGKRKKIKL